MPPLEEYVGEISSVWDTRMLTNAAPKHRKLEDKLKTYLEADRLKLFVNGHSALESLIRAFGLTGEVITTPFTFASTTHAIVNCGLRPVFCDIRSDNFTMDVACIEPLITEKTSAIIPVHVYGTACDVDGIGKIASKHGLKVIYDAAHAFGVRVRGRGIAAYGDASMFSFHATKLYHTVEGGAAAFKEEEMDVRLSALRDFGMTGPERVEYVSGNGKMDEFRAAMGLCNLRHIGETIQKRKHACERYDRQLSGINGIRTLPAQPGVQKNYSYYPILLNGYKLSRDELRAELARRGITTRRYFYPPTCDFPCYRREYGAAAVPVARYISDNVLCLPLYTEISDEEVDYVCAALRRL